MTRARLLLTVGAVAALVVPAPGGSHTTRSAWTTFDAEQRLTIGRFAAANGIKFATCIGTGPATGAPGPVTRKFKHLECTVQGKSFTNERQIVVHVRSETAFTPEWLTTKEC